MKIENKLKTKKFQTQKFVNEYLQKQNIRCTSKIKKQALDLLKKKGFREFESVYIKSNFDRTINAANTVIHTISNVFNNFADGIRDTFLAT